MRTLRLATLLVVAPILAPAASAQYATPSAFAPMHADAAQPLQHRAGERCVGLRVMTAVVSTLAGATAGYLGYLFTHGLAFPDHGARNAWIAAGTVFGALYGGIPALFSDCADLPPRRRRPR